MPIDRHSDKLNKSKSSKINREFRPSDLSLPGFMDEQDREIACDLETIPTQNDPVQLEEEQYSDDFETIEHPKEMDLVIQERTKQLVEQSSTAALSLSGVKLEEASVDQQAEQIL